MSGPVKHEDKEPTSLNTAVSAANQVRLDLGLSTSQYLHQFVGFADAKLAAVVAGGVAAIALLLIEAQTYASRIFGSSSPSGSHGSVSLSALALVFSWSSVACQVLAFVLLGCSVSCAVWGFYPRRDRIQSHDSNETDETELPLLYFEGIAARGSWQRYYNEVKFISAENLIREHAKNNYDLSALLRLKYDCLRRSMWLFALGLGAVLLSGCLTVLVVHV